MAFETIQTDLLIIGGGVAGLRAAAAAAEKGVSVLVVSKGGCASPEIMGLNAPVLPEDSVKQYFDDTEKSGYGINDSRLAKLLAENVLGDVAWLEENGVHFARDESGQYAPIHTLGTKYPRLIRAGVSSGAIEMSQLRRLIQERGVRVDAPVDILGLITPGGRIAGAWGLRHGAAVCYRARAVILATGGCGAIQDFTTYPASIVGDGYAMAYEAGAGLVDMEIQQFEPCCFVWPEEIRGKVIATTLLRHGAELRNGEGRTFMEDYGLSRENAQKGSLARAMLAEVRAGRGSPHGGIYYDMTMFDEDFLYKDHEIFTKHARQVGMDLTKEMPEMMPAAHTNLGGVIIDEGCMTEVEGLFACGEVVGGLHGGNRIGGSAGAETVVFGHLAGDSAASYVLSGAQELSDEAFSRALGKIEAEIRARLDGRACLAGEIRARLGACLHKNLGIVRNRETIRAVDQELTTLRQMLGESGAASPEELAENIHAAHMLTLAQMQATASGMREESRGVFFRDDFPDTDEENWRKNIVIRRRGDEMVFSTRAAIRVTPPEA